MDVEAPSLRNPLQVVLDNMPAKVYVCDVDTYEILYTNQAAQQHTSYAGAQLRLRQVLSLMKGSCSCDKNCEQPGWECCREYHDEKEGVWWQMNKAYTEWTDGRKVHVVTVSDLTEQKKLEAELVAARYRAEEIARKRSAFIASMSHEIRTPMNAIVGFLDLLCEEGEELDEQTRKEFIGIVTDNAGQLLSLIGDLLDISKLEAGQMKLIPEAGNLNQLMHNIYLSFSASTVLGQGAVEFQLQVPEDQKESVFELDFVRLRQILENLINNALKFTEKGYVKFGYRLTSDSFQFFVTDTGIGIAKDKLDELGIPFNQVHDSSLASKYGGSGIGLAISKNLVELMGGVFRVQSQLERGTTFSFSIPFS